MASSSPPPAGQEQRQLAAIVFTDVVGFSARMQSEESATLTLVERDFAVMRALAAELSGAVLKSTGDGLLILFTSAVHAVDWALQIQRRFAAQGKTLPPEEVLRHRVGVHVGDVFVSGGDVMGDGVNIAARLQAQAPTGGICISQSVYDLVKNKMKLDVVRLEPRKLKNISDVVQMYHLLLEPRPVVAAAPATFQHAPVVETPEPPSGRPKYAIVAAVLAMLVVGAWLLRSHFEHEKGLKESQADQAKLGALLSGKNATGADAKATSAPPPATSPSGEMEFAQRALDRPAGSGATADDARLLQEAKSAMLPAVAWAMRELPRYSRQRPLRVRPMDRSSTQVLTVYSDPEGRIYFVEGGASRRQSWADLRPDSQGAILLGLLRSAGDVPPEVTRGAGAFAYVNGLTEMARSLVDSPAR
ncbi:MAG TPA: adenylate/guanylate cyclase domain-containing protein [Opitutaceae bacterium]|nr:adenylate/guanylate cyclase domain-containing protein [Opitutaceae bacterium]